MLLVVSFPNHLAPEVVHQNRRKNCFESVCISIIRRIVRHIVVHLLYVACQCTRTFFSEHQQGGYSVFKRTAEILVASLRKFRCVRTRTGARGRVIFSDGVETDFLKFNSGTVVNISTLQKQLY